MGLRLLGELGSRGPQALALSEKSDLPQMRLINLTLAIFKICALGQAATLEKGWPLGNPDGGMEGRGGPSSWPGPPQSLLLWGHRETCPPGAGDSRAHDRSEEHLPIRPAPCSPSAPSHPRPGVSPSETARHKNKGE